MAIVVTPIRNQYLSVKKAYPEAIVLFQLGDFFETFDEDAEITSRILEIVLTQRDMGNGEIVPMAGIPHHALDNYLGKLVRAGFRVAICRQTTKAQLGTGLVDRKVVRVVTKGTIVEESLLDSRSNNYLVAVVLGAVSVGISYVDVTTGEFALAEVPLSQLPQELARLDPQELLYDREHWESQGISTNYFDSLSPAPVPNNAIVEASELFTTERCTQRLQELFGGDYLAKMGSKELPLGVRAAGGIVQYLDVTFPEITRHITGFQVYRPDNFMIIDGETRKHLELFEGGGERLRSHSLWGVLDMTDTPMGSRLLKRWIGQPLIDLDALEQRLDCVQWFTEDALRRTTIRTLLKDISDPERVLTRIGSEIALPREVNSLLHALRKVPELKELLGSSIEALNRFSGELDPCFEATEIIASTLADPPQGELGSGGVIRAGFSPELDEIRDASRDARAYIASLEKQERTRTGINNLKVGYNRVFGYYIEVSNSHLDKIPDDYVRRQTLAGSERFYTQELKNFENVVLNARDRLEELEKAIFADSCKNLLEFWDRILITTAAIAKLDVLSTFGEVASRNDYVRPKLNGGTLIKIEQGRHPVVERHLPRGQFVPNDVCIDSVSDQLIILTGPNMGGKSTYLRQTALLVLLAQIGSFIPAKEALIGLADKIFTRVGLHDNLSAGQSTFMVEMVETATILNNATPNSLVILDEIGRGTSTFDGMSIARAVLEHLHNSPRLGCRTLFATHYHELTKLSEGLPRVRNYTVGVLEENDAIVFLHRILSGSADRSYGINVAKLAGLPQPVLERAKEILTDLEGQGITGLVAPATRQLPLFGTGVQIPPFVKKLWDVELDSITPLEALAFLSEIQSSSKDQIIDPFASG